MLRQILIVSVLNLKSLKGRFWQSMVIVVGLAATIGVMLSVLSMGAGMARAYYNAGDPNRAIVVSKGADQEGQSAITRAMAPMVADAPGIARDKGGKSLADRGLNMRSEEHTSELQSQSNLVCRLLLEKKNRS